MAPAPLAPAAGSGTNHSMLSVGASGASTVSVWEWRQWEQDCRQTGDRGHSRGGAGRGVEDGLRSTPVPTATLWPKIPFKIHEFVLWAPSKHLGQFC